MSNNEAIVDITVLQNGTTDDSAAAMLDTETEGKLYHLYRAFFQQAEDERSWNLWNDIPWDDIGSNPPTNLVDAVFAVYRDDLFLPDYASKSLHLLRASRGRAWFWTRWSYEEGKHLMTWIEWLTRSGAFTDEYLRNYANQQLEEYRCEPPVRDAIGIFWDALLWEQREIASIDGLLPLAEGAGDVALVNALTKIRVDEIAQYDFIRACLKLIQEKHSDKVTQSATEVATINEIGGGSAALLGRLT